MTKIEERMFKEGLLIGGDMIRLELSLKILSELIQKSIIFG